MTLEQVRYFLAVAETGSFTAAARRCGVAQPSLSQQVGQLERGLKRRLFDRLPRQVMLTEAGRELLPGARRLLEAFEELARSPGSGALRGSVVVGAVPTVAPFVVAAAVGEFAKMHSAVDMSLEEMPTEVILARVRSGLCDVGIVVGGVEDSQILVEGLFTEMLVAAMPRRHRLAARGEIGLEELAGETVILLDEMKGIFRSGSVRARKERGRILRGSGLQVATVEALVELGAGVCLLPAMARRKQGRRGIVYCGIRGSAAVREVNAVWHRDRVRSGAALAFMEALRGAVAQVL